LSKHLLAKRADARRELVDAVTTSIRARGDLHAVALACPKVGQNYQNECKMLDVAATDPDDYLRMSM
jgi:hypothetical protein